MKGLWDHGRLQLLLVMVVVIAGYLLFGAYRCGAFRISCVQVAGHAKRVSVTPW